MIDDIKSKNAENMALITMVLDEVLGIYQTEGSVRLYEVERLESALVPALYMLDERVQDINELADKILEAEVSEKKEGDNEQPI
ncbi:hypothetical protein [Lactococcus petauri]|uniref:hypothetical protein n=1 Tax=Lactococcus petauri TaxID=1940789 RepID=UPI0002E1E2B6|nr:hypothetical protein [Lactococcus petauri]MCV5952203.1 hypothetical protein [Lactococcus petauri]MCV5966744.1 hypothetical protein [Lactococcus petauri]MCV5969202.1 hypothetical protein [Lactococcus petauri]MCV5980058.1 hypothetical protein [Lactococcus petauri]TBH80000.1 hypothetical protein EX190_04400 [Lactococcus petauri]